jgi:hypothetical protein
MNAPQDVWAGPLALKMVSKYRSKALTYIRIQPGPYDETTGTTSLTETSIPAAGAVVQSGKGEVKGVQQDHEMEAWIDHVTVPWPISTNDRLQYLGRRWKIVDILTYGSGGGDSKGPVYITTLDGKILTTLDGKAIIAQGESSNKFDFSMYASRLRARAE